MTAYQSFSDLFIRATGIREGPYPYQVRWAEVREPPSMVSVPTGLGKTAGAILSWLWRRRYASEEIRQETPRRLVYCLPMRVLVEQTHDCAVKWLRNLGILGGRIDADGSYDPWDGDDDPDKIRVHLLMGGEVDRDWDMYPERDAILIGTQDMLLSRALNRGYALSRFRWPVQYALLNNDCLWVMDEVQLMGSGLWTTAQLDWMRRKRFTTFTPCVSTWMSATVGSGFLATTDRKREGFDVLTRRVKVGVADIWYAGEKKEGLDVTTLFDAEREYESNAEIDLRLSAKRPVDWFSAKSKSDSTLAERIAGDVIKRHQVGTLSLVVCNTVEMARNVFRELSEKYPKILLTSRFRRCDRRAHERKILEFEENRRANEGKPVPNNEGLICVSTQVIEAGVDISCHYLWSELAPWPSVIQRLGRINRDGRDPEAQAWFWESPNKGRGKQERIGPYEAADIARSKKLLDALKSPSQEKPFSKALKDI